MLFGYTFDDQEQTAISGNFFVYVCRGQKLGLDEIWKMDQKIIKNAKRF